MKTCPTCRRNYPDEYGFCLDDGSTLSESMEGEKTELIKGPYLPGGTTEQLAANPGSDATLHLPTPRYEPAPTEASPLPTIKSNKPPPADPEIGSGPTPVPSSDARWIVASLVLAAVVGLTIFAIDRNFGLPAASRDQATNIGNATQTDSNPLTVNFPTPSQNLNAQPMGNQPVQTLVAIGTTEAETIPQDFKAEKRGHVNHWYVHQGDYYEPCGRNIVFVTTFQELAVAGGGTSESQYGEDLKWNGPVVVQNIDVSEGEDYVLGQRLARLGQIQHMWVNATVPPADTARLNRDTRVTFTALPRKRIYNGMVDSVDHQTGAVRIMLADSDVFEPDNAKCLTISPNRPGEVRFASSGADH